jgi:hypothetical protein
MFGSKKKHILTEGAQALAVVTKVDYATVLGGMTVARDYNYKLDLTLMVRPDNEAPFEAHVQGYFSQFAQPSVGDQLYVRYNPDDHEHVEIDTAKIAADNAAVEQAASAMAASAVPADLAANGIVGRAGLVDVQKTPAGSLIDCAVTLNIRLIDGTAPYRASCHVPLSSDQAELLIPGRTFVTVRVDPSNHQRVALSLTEDTPVVPVDDPAILDPPVRAMAEGAPCRVAILLHQRQWLKTPAGDEFYAVKVRVTADGSEFQVNVPVPTECVEMLQDGAELPAKRIALEPNVLTIDWAAAQAEHTMGNVA